MQKYILSLSTLFFSVLTAFSASTEMATTGGVWSDSAAWKNGVPTSVDSIITPITSCTMIVDGNYTVVGITGNYATKNFIMEFQPDTSLTASSFTTSFECPNTGGNFDITFDGGTFNYTGATFTMGTSVGGSSLGSTNTNYAIKLAGSTNFTNANLKIESYNASYKNTQTDGKRGRIANYKVAVLDTASATGNVSLYSTLYSAGENYTDINIPLTLQVGSAENKTAAMSVAGGLSMNVYTNLDVYGSMTVGGVVSAKATSGSAVNIYSGGTLTTTYTGTSFAASTYYN